MKFSERARRAVNFCIQNCLKTEACKDVLYLIQKLKIILVISYLASQNFSLFYLLLVVQIYFRNNTRLSSINVKKINMTSGTLTLRTAPKRIKIGVESPTSQILLGDMHILVWMTSPEYKLYLLDET